LAKAIKGKHDDAQSDHGGKTGDIGSVASRSSTERRSCERGKGERAQKVGITNSLWGGVQEVDKPKKNDVQVMGDAICAQGEGDKKSRGGGSG